MDAYTIADKIRALELLDASATGRASPYWTGMHHQTGISRKTLRRWWQQREQIRAQQPARPALVMLPPLVEPSVEETAAPLPGTREAWFADLYAARTAAMRKGAFTAVATLLRMEGEALGFNRPPAIEATVDPIEAASIAELEAIIAGELEAIPLARLEALGVVG